MIRKLTLLCFAALTPLQPIGLSASGPRPCDGTMIPDGGGGFVCAGINPPPLMLPDDPNSEPLSPKLAVYDWQESVYGARSTQIATRQLRKGLWVVELEANGVEINSQGMQVGVVGITFGVTSHTAQFNVESAARRVAIDKFSANAIKPRPASQNYSYLRPLAEGEEYTSEIVHVPSPNEMSTVVGTITGGPRLRPKDRTILNVQSTNGHTQFIGVDQDVTIVDSASGLSGKHSAQQPHARRAFKFRLPLSMSGTRLLSEKPPTSDQVVVGQQSPYTIYVQPPCDSYICPNDAVSQLITPPPAYYTVVLSGGGGFERGEGRLVLNRQLTQALNAQDLSFDQAIEFLKQDYAGKGYTVVEE